jgi:hypothetical protein
VQERLTLRTDRLLQCTVGCRYALSDILVRGTSRQEVQTTARAL